MPRRRPTTARSTPQGPLPDEVCLRGRQGEQGLELRSGEHASSRHGVSPSGCICLLWLAPEQEQGFAGCSAVGVQLGQQASLRAAAYCRVSTADQSCARQERDLAAFAGRSGYEVVGTCKETTSGVELDRPAGHPQGTGSPAGVAGRVERHGVRPHHPARAHDGDAARRHRRVRAQADRGAHPLRHRRGRDLRRSWSASLGSDRSRTASRRR